MDTLAAPRSPDSLPPADTFEPRRDWLHLVAIFSVLFLLYALTAPRTVALEDDGLFVLAGYFLGIAHPPGYPLHTLISHLFTLVPIGSIAYRVHLVSAFCGALTCVALWCCARLMVAGRTPAWVAALGFGVSETFWSQSIIAEVYTLNTFFFFVMFYLALRINRSRATSPAPCRTRLYLLAFIYGLSLTNHWPLIALSTPALLVLLWPRRMLVVRHLHTLAVLTLLGLSPYLWMVLRSQSAPLISFYGPLTSWHDFWFYIARKGYAGADTSVSAGWLDKVQYGGFLIREVLTQLSIIGFPFAAWGFIGQFTRWPWQIVAACLLAFAGPTVVLLLLVNFDYDYFYRAVFSVYPLIAYAILAIWMGLGFQLGITALRSLGIRAGTMTAATAAIATVLIVTPLLTNMHKNNRADYTFAEIYARGILESLPRNAILFVDGDVDGGTIGYFNLVEHLRPDIAVYHKRGLVFPTRLAEPHHIAPGELARVVRTFIASVDRPVFATGAVPHHGAAVELGLYQQINGSQPQGDALFRLDPDLFAVYARLMAMDDRDDTWTQAHQRRLSEQFGRVLGATLPLPSVDPAVTARTALVTRYLDGYIGMIEGTLHNPRPVTLDEASRWIASAAKLITGDTKKRPLAALYNTEAALATKRGQVEAAMTLSRLSIDVWPNPENPAIGNLLKLYATHRRSDDYWQLRHRYYGNGGATDDIERLDRAVASRP